MNNSILFKTRTVLRKLTAPMDRPLARLAAAWRAHAPLVIVRASPQRINAHFSDLPVGQSCLIVAAPPLHRRRKTAPSRYVMGVVFLLAAAMFGDISKGAQGWLNLGFTRMRRSETLRSAAPTRRPRAAGDAVTQD